MKKVFSFLILFLVFGCSTPSTYNTKHIATVGIIEIDPSFSSRLPLLGTPVFIGQSEKDITEAFTIAFKRCEEHISKRKINKKQGQCRKRSARSPGSKHKSYWPSDKEMANIQKEALEKIKIEKNKKLALIKKRKFEKAEKTFGSECSENSLFKKGFAKGSPEYIACINEKETTRIKAQKELDAKLAKMTPVQRREYNCEETFQFRKGSDKFKDCVFKLYTTELELQKLELQKQVAEAKLEAEKAKAKAAATEKARADAVARAQIAAAEAQKAAAKSQSLATSMSLMQLGSSMMSSPAPAPSNTGRVRTTCRNVGVFLNCY